MPDTEALISKAPLPRTNPTAAMDPLSMLPRLLTKLYSVWISTTYPFVACGSRLSMHYTVELRREVAHLISIGGDVLIAKDAWLNVAREDDSQEQPAITIEDNCVIARRVQLSARNSIYLERDVILAASVIIMDHNHAYENIDVPIRDQGITAGGRIRIEAGSWVGHGAAIVCDRGDLVIGRNSVVAANAVVTRSCPPYSVLSGNPARVVKQFDPARRLWVMGSVRTAASETERSDQSSAHIATQEKVLL